MGGCLNDCCWDYGHGGIGSIRAGKYRRLVRAEERATKWRNYWSVDEAIPLHRWVDGRHASCDLNNYDKDCHAMNTNNDFTSRKFPPIAEIAVSTLALVIIGGVYLASHLPNHISLAPTTALVSIAAALVLVNVSLLLRLKNFNWKTFALVAKWTLLVYLIISGTLEYVFIYDGMRGSLLALMSSALFIFAINLPILFGFTVARYAESPA